jgi:hypothetical protein
MKWFVLILSSVFLAGCGSTAGCFIQPDIAACVVRFNQQGSGQ